MSVIYELLQAVKKRVGDVVGCPAPKIRKKPVVLQGDTFPLCLVCFIAPERVVMQAMSNVVVYGYPIFVGLVWQSDRDFEVGPSSSLELREAVRNQLFQPLLMGISSAPDGGGFDLDFEPGIPFDFAGQSSANFETTSFLITPHVSERRAA